MKNKVLKNIFGFTFIFALLISTIDFHCFDRNFYTREHEKILLYGQHLPEYIGISTEELKEITDVTLDYLKDREKTLDLKMNIKGQMREVFNETEKTHMVDVRELYLSAMTVRNVCLAICVLSLFLLTLSLKNKAVREIREGYRNALWFFLFVFAGIGIAAVIDFDSFWTTFHHIFFAGNDLWILNLRTDVLIMIVPPEFFYHLCLRIVLSFLCIIILLAFLMKVLERRMYHD